MVSVHVIEIIVSAQIEEEYSKEVVYYCICVSILLHSAHIVYSVVTVDDNSG